MKVLLIEPPFERFIGQRCEWYPIGLTSIATVLEDHGHRVRVYNAEHDNTLRYINTEVYIKNYYRYQECLTQDQDPVWREVSKTIETFVPDVVGISVKSVKIPAALKIAEICKGLDNRIKVIAGGFHATTRPEDLLKSPHIDMVVRGEGEKTFLELMKHLEGGNGNLRGIKGVSFRGPAGEVVTTEDRALISPLDTMPFPRRELILSYESYTPEQLGWVMTSRGCPYDCAYCNSRAIWGRRVRFHHLTRIIEEIAYLKSQFKVSHINFMDDSFTVSKNRILEFCRLLTDRRSDLAWSCLTRADLIDEKVASVMKAAGCVKVDIGVESGSERIQALMNKGIKLDDVEKASCILRKCGIFWTGFFMLGFPTETKEDILMTLNFMKKIKPNWAYLSIFTPYPGSKFYDMVKNDGLISDEEDRSSFSHQSPRNCFSKNISSEEFKEVAELMFREFNKYNNSVSSLLRRALSQRYHKNPGHLIRDAKKALSWLRSK